MGFMLYAKKNKKWIKLYVAGSEGIIITRVCLRFLEIILVWFAGTVIDVQYGMEVNLAYVYNYIRTDQKMLLFTKTLLV